MTTNGKTHKKQDKPTIKLTTITPTINPAKLIINKEMSKEKIVSLSI